MSNSKVVVILIVFAFSLVSVAQTAKPEFSIAVSAPVSVKSGSPILLEITVSNVSNHLIAFDTDIARYAERSFDIRVTDSNGKPVQATPYMQAVRGESEEPKGPTILVEPTTVWWELQPGEILKQTADLRKSFEFKPGKYTVQVSRNDYHERISAPPASNPECGFLEPHPAYCNQQRPQPIAVPQVKAVAKSNIFTFIIVP